MVDKISRKVSPPNGVPDIGSSWATISLIRSCPFE